MYMVYSNSFICEHLKGRVAAKTAGVGHWLVIAVFPTEEGSAGQCQDIGV